jgi:integrase
MMLAHIRMDRLQILCRSPYRPQFTLSLKSYLGDDLPAICNLQWRVESLLQAQASGVDHIRSTRAWLESIPRKPFRNYLERMLLHCDPDYQRDQTVESLADAIDLFADARRQSTKSKWSTDEALLRDVELLLKLDLPLSLIDEESLQALLDRLGDEQELAANTLAKYAGRWHTFFKWLVKEGWIASNPASGLKRAIERRDKPEIKSEWIDALVMAGDREWAYWLRLVQWTGCRLREGLSLRPCDFDVARRRINIVDTKRGCVRVNPLYSAIAEYLPDLAGLDPELPIVRNVTAATCYTGLARLQCLAGVERWSPPYNSFRATRANQLAASLNEQQAGLLMGHSAIVARQNYLSVDDALIERLVAE